MAILTITPFLWFDHQAEEAATFYTSIFPDSRVRRVVRYGATGPGPAGSVMTVEFELGGQVLVALNGGPVFTFNEAVSFVVSCDTQEEIDAYWQALSAGGQSRPCGWVKDRFGLSWQVVPAALAGLLSDSDQRRNDRVMAALMQMEKIDLSTLEAACGRA